MGSREQFEAWVVGLNVGYIVESYNGGEYTCSEVQGLWAAWQASRAALSIRVPTLTTLDSYPPLHIYGPADLAKEYRRGHLDLLGLVVCAGVGVRDR